MPIMAVQDQNDARGSARVLAIAAKRCIDAFDYSADEKVALNGVFRLLKAYRSHGLSGFEYQPPPQRGLEALTIFPSGESHIGEVRTALDRAISCVYHDEDQDSALESLEQVFRALARREPPVPNERARTSEFLDTFVQNLQAAG